MIKWSYSLEDLKWKDTQGETFVFFLSLFVALRVKRSLTDGRLDDS